jgi:DNA-3-methyladenine glycosylase II
MNNKKTLFIPLPADFSWEECTWYLDRNYDECLHTLAGGKIIKAVRLDGRDVLFRLGAGNGGLEAEILWEGGAGGGAGGRQTGGNEMDGWEVDVRDAGGPAVAALLREYIVDWLDLERDLTSFYELLKKDKRLAYMSGEYRGLRLIGIVDLFEALCWCVIGQQINLRFAYATKRRLVERFGGRIVYEGKTHYLFPACGDLALATEEELRAMQFSRGKTKYLVGLAQAFSSGEWSKEKLIAVEGLENRRKMLTDLKGVGIWTANYCLMKSLRDTTCIPHGDVGLLNALAAHSIIKDRQEEEKIARLFKKYPGWESYLVFYLWRSLAEKGKTE